MRMQPRAVWKVGTTVAVMLWTGSLTAPSSAAGESKRWVLDPTSTEVSFDVGATGHDIHGSVAVGSGEILFDTATGSASGAIVVGAASALTGNNGRDKTLRHDVFEADRFPEIRFVPARFTGELPESGTAAVTLEGSIVMLGLAHPLSLPARVTVSGPRVLAETTFSIPFLEWGLHDPSIMFLRVGKVVAVTVKAAGTLTGLDAEAPAR